MMPVDVLKYEGVPGMIRDGLETVAGFLPPQRLPDELNVLFLPTRPTAHLCSAATDSATR